MTRFLKIGKKVMQLAAVVAALAVLFIYAMFQGGFVSWFLFYSVTTLALMQLLLLIYPLRSLRAERRLTAEMLSFNGSAEVDVTLKKRIPLPLIYVKVRDHQPYGLREWETSAEALVFPFFQREASYSYSIKGRRRGKHTIDYLRVRSGDLFGFVEKDYDIPVSSTVVVLPRMRKLANWNTTADNSSEAVSLSQRLQSESVNVAGVRDYTPGDRMANIDWKVTARAGKLVTKEFEAEKGEGYFLLLENALGTTSESFETAVEFAASLTEYAYQMKMPIGCGVTASEQLLQHPGTSKEHFQRIYQSLAYVELNTDTEASPFLRQTPGLEALIYVTPELSGIRIKELKQWAEQKRSVIVALLPHESGFSRHEGVEALRHTNIHIYYVQPGEAGFEVL
ncbi:DUF58 domain-containing protein [Marinococcus luteus]|uniref:DUF58 domain-containing protein n=1 Tax=Marinococcus luteus TaxID=1122204 RepID=UPI002ACD0A62|nr:DUF58 domain-containing protein [Marinococcus luteus]MDZ5783319.1 DUF58 domain-containing protein [Marinococcus luteus]